MGKYWNCAYKDLETGECCFGTEEGEPCLDATNEKCEVFDPRQFPSYMIFSK